MSCINNLYCASGAQILYVDFCSDLTESLLPRVLIKLNEAERAGKGGILGRYRVYFNNV
jgi:hypothetical protein